MIKKINDVLMNACHSESNLYLCDVPDGQFAVRNYKSTFRGTIHIFKFASVGLCVELARKLGSWGVGGEVERELGSEPVQLCMA